MAWTAPATWSTSEVVLASKMNAHVRDNLLYLKGQAGTIYTESDVGVGDSTLTSDWTAAVRNMTIGTTASPGSSALALKGTRTGSDVVFARLVGVNLAATGVDKTGGEIDFNRDSAADSASISFLTRNAGTIAERMRIDRSGNTSIGSTLAGGKLYVAGAGGGFAIMSAAAVTTLQTVAVAGTVVRSMEFWLVDHNNTGHVVSTATSQLNIGTSTTYINTDTMTIAVTAGGAVTIQRTSGTNGTHDVTIMALFV